MFSQINRFAPQKEFFCYRLLRQQFSPWFYYHFNQESMWGIYVGNLKTNINNISLLPQSQLYKEVCHGSVAKTMKCQGPFRLPCGQCTDFSPHLSCRGLDKAQLCLDKVLFCQLSWLRGADTSWDFSAGWRVPLEEYGRHLSWGRVEVRESWRASR